MARKKQRQNQKKGLFKPRSYYKRLSKRNPDPDIRLLAKEINKALKYYYKYKNSEDSIIKPIWMAGHQLLTQNTELLKQYLEEDNIDWNNTIRGGRVEEVEVIDISESVD